jgi:hypothetical protein
MKSYREGTKEDRENHVREGGKEGEEESDGGK